MCCNSLYSTAATHSTICCNSRTYVQQLTHVYVLQLPHISAATHSTYVLPLAPQYAERHYSTKTLYRALLQKRPIDVPALLQKSPIEIHMMPYLCKTLLKSSTRVSALLTHAICRSLSAKEPLIIGLFCAKRYACDLCVYRVA